MVQSIRFSRPVQSYSVAELVSALLALVASVGRRLSSGWVGPDPAEAPYVPWSQLRTPSGELVSVRVATGWRRCGACYRMADGTEVIETPADPRPNPLLDAAMSEGAGIHPRLRPVADRASLCEVARLAPADVADYLAASLAPSPSRPGPVGMWEYLTGGPTDPPTSPKPTRRPRVRLAPSAERRTDSPTVYTADVRPASAVDVLVGLGKYSRYSPGGMLARGWAADSHHGWRVADPDRATILAKLDARKCDTAGRGPDIEFCLPRTVHPGGFVLTGRKAHPEDGRAVGVLSRWDGATVYVDLRQYLTVLRHCPGCLIVGQEKDADRNSLVAVRPDDVGAYTRDKATGVLMPMTAACESYPDWTPDDEPLTLKASGLSMRLTRGQWRAVRDGGANAVSLTPSKRTTLTTLVDLVGRAGLSELIGEGVAQAA